MGRYTKNIIALGFILMLAAPLSVSIISILQQNILHKKIVARFNTEIIQTITIAKADLYWAKKNKEVIIDGKYFDVKSFTTKGDKIVLTGFYDHHEDKLVKRMTKLMQQKNGSESPINQLAVKYFFFPVFMQQTDVDFNQHWKTTNVKFYSYSDNIPEIRLSTISPPPKV